MKRIIAAFICAAVTTVCSTSASAQKAPPKSPPAADSVVLGGKVISVKYSAPSVRGRDIFGKEGLISKEKNYPIWRAGANTSTTFSTAADLVIDKLKVPAGTYTLFVSLVDTENWELIINKQVGQWGLTYDAAQDLGRVKMKTSKTTAPVEVLLYDITAEGNKKAKLTLTWDNYTAFVPISVK